MAHSAANDDGGPSSPLDPRTRPAPALRYVGRSVNRVEDVRLLTGTGRFVADHEPAGVLHAAFFRSQVAHARIRSLDVSAARRATGVVAVFTGSDMKELTHPFPPIAMAEGLYTPLYWALSEDKVRMVGDPMAVVIARSRYLAEDALELIEVDYEPLPPVATLADALSPSSPPLWDEAGDNVVCDRTERFGEVDSVFARADRVVSERFRSHRQSNQPMETRGIVVEVDDTGHLTVTAATQSSHLLRWSLAALTGRTPVSRALRRLAADKDRRSALVAGTKAFLTEHREALSPTDDTAHDPSAGIRAQLARDKGLLRHVAPMVLDTITRADYPTVRAHDIGGGFGSKIATHREDVAVAAAAIALGRSVKWIEDRVENLVDGGHARDEDLTVSLALDEDGTLRGLKVDLVIDQGAYPGFPFAANGNAAMMRTMIPGAYDFAALEFRTRAVTTNKGRYLAYRGPWANETWVRERMIDVAARAIGRSPIEVRLANMFGDDKPGTAMLTGPAIDETLSTKATLRRALEVVDLAAFERDRCDAEARGHLLGLGVACYHEAAPGPPGFMGQVSPGADPAFVETARTTVAADGRIVVYTPQMPHGQGHQTTYAQLVADELGVSMDDVELVWGDTDRTPFSVIGTGGSRGGPVGGGAVKYAAREVRRRIVDRAATLLEASAADIDIVDGNVHVRGVPARGLSFAEVAASVSAVDDVAFDVTQRYSGNDDGGWSCATHVCVVDIDVATGVVEIPRYVVVEDCGPVINPSVVDGQIRGAVAQGIGAVLYERVVFDADANPRATTYLDYLVPTCAEIPEIEIHHLETLAAGENDFRGVGEGGLIGAPAAITNAIDDAIAARGGRVTEQHLPPERILELIGELGPRARP